MHRAHRDAAPPPEDAVAQTTADLRALADEQTALRHVAELVAAGASESTVFDAVAHQACRLLGGHFTALLRYESDGPLIVAMHGAAAVEHFMHVGMRIAAEGDGVVQRVQRTGRAARVDGYSSVPGWNAGIARDLGLTSGVGAPIITEGQVWGAITVLASGAPLSASAETRLEMFAKLVAVAIANAQAQTAATTLAEEQAALRRVAELVARGVAPEEVFDAVATEASRLLSGEAMTLTRFDGKHELFVEATCRGPAPVGTRVTVAAGTLPDWIRRGDHVVRVDDYTQERDAELAAQFGLAAAVAAPISVEGEVWGMLTGTSDALPLPRGTEPRLHQFAELVAAALANTQARGELQALADEQTALRLIAQLSARQAPTAAVLQAVAVQASRLAGVEFGMVLRFIGPDGANEIVALDGAPANFTLGLRAPGSGDGSVHRVWRTGRAARVDNLDAMSGRWPQMASQFGFSTSAGVPILLQEGELWGALIVAGRDSMPAAIESHLADFAELASTAISAAQTRAQLRVLADEQAALRRVAELVARGAPLDEVFTATTTEASKLLGDQAAALLRHESDGYATVVAAHNSPVSLGLRLRGDGDTAAGLALRIGQPVRVEIDEGSPLAESAPGVGGSVTVPILVEGRAWGTLSTSTAGAPLTVGTDDRLTQFAELAAAAIANAENRAKLTASRARVVATADETRRRLQRDLHDGAQQRLVHTLLALGIAKEAAAEGRPAGELIDDAIHHAERANTELRDLVRGILPASLTRGGLRTAVESLISDMPVPIEVDVTTPRLAPEIETTAYFIVAEGLTNVIKHARATRAVVAVHTDGPALSIQVRDDGCGGADLAHGTGLIGLLDRVEASNGTFTLTSPPTVGTTVQVRLPARNLDTDQRPPERHTISG
ncbi:MAG: GAF domain-containing protein [Solirubrobacteraceae bacterium]